MALDLTRLGGKFIPGLKKGLVGCWDMDEAAWDGTPGEVVDRSGLGNHGTAVNGATTAPGKIGRAASLQRALNQYVHIPHDDSLNLGSAGTVAVWARSDSEFPSADGAMKWWGLVSKDLSGLVSGIVYDVSWEGTNTTHEVKCRLGDGVNYNSINRQLTFNGEWRLIIFRWDGDYLYLTVDNVHETPVAQTVVPQALETGLCIGRGFNSNLYTFDGLIDLAALRNICIPDAECDALWNGGAGRALAVGDFTLPPDVRDARPTLEVTKL